MMRQNQKGKTLTTVLAVTYAVIRLGDIVLNLANRTSLLEENQTFFNVIFIVLIAFLAIRGHVLLSGVLILLTPVANLALLLIAAPIYGGFSTMLRQVPSVWFNMFLSALCLAIAVTMLTSPSVRDYGRAQLGKPRPAAPEPEEAAALLAQFPGETAAVHLTSRRVWGARRQVIPILAQMISTKFGCTGHTVDESSSVLTFPEGGALLLRWLNDQKCVYLESDTGRYAPEFHQTVLDVIAFLNKDGTVKFEL